MEIAQIYVTVVVNLTVGAAADSIFDTDEFISKADRFTVNPRAFLLPDGIYIELL